MLNVIFSTGRRHIVKASREVILAAGVIGSLQILQLSGIGPKDVLSSVGIETVVNEPAVGQGYQDHALVAMHYKVTSPNTWDVVLRNPPVFGKTMEQWATERKGLFVNSPANTRSYLRIPGDDPLFKDYSDPAAGSNSAHFELIFIVS